jgi:hypothetical protein
LTPAIYRYTSWLTIYLRLPLTNKPCKPRRVVLHNGWAWLE